MSETELRIEYAKRTYNIDLSDELDQMIEDDYVINRHNYTDDAFKQLQVLLVLIDNNQRDIEIFKLFKNII
ncbi:hypothetical protein BA893_06975 [Vibrio natriegens]|uniref:hypothetical protein n=1 Tax=Vibrio natriegens TaxID=691 RepID=UPI0008041D97|nr:hypothetical protein [Vibrio natriegens]ANQ21423.1 hypothetical protein BA893_06975 [Vibrio natriegens]